MNGRLARSELASNAEATRTRRLGPGHGSGGTPPKVRDDTQGLEVEYAQEYQPSLRRFVCRDPLYNSSRQIIHNYVYADNNPATLTDPTGLMPIRAPPQAGPGPGFLTPCWTMPNCIDCCNFREWERARAIHWINRYVTVAGYLAPFFSDPITLIKGYITGLGKSVAISYGAFPAAKWANHYFGDRCRELCPKEEIDTYCPEGDTSCCDINRLTGGYAPCCPHGRSCIICYMKCPAATCDSWDYCYSWGRTKTEGCRSKGWYWIGPVDEDTDFYYELFRCSWVVGNPNIPPVTGDRDIPPY